MAAGAEAARTSAGEAAAADDGPTEIESLCPECEENGLTRILMLTIPHFREIVLMAFTCTHCGERNSEVQFAGVFLEKGRRYSLTVAEGDLRSLNRQVVKSDYATLRIPELEFEIEAGTQKATLTTVEGLVTHAATNLRVGQPERRRLEMHEVADKIDEFCARLDSLAVAESAFTVEIDDPSGNSYVESYESDPTDDPVLTVEHYERTSAQNEKMGLKVKDEEGEKPEISPDDPYHGPNSRGIISPGSAIARGSGNEVEAALCKYTSPEEVMVFPGSCYACNAEAETRMFVTKIPFFREVVVMSNSCEQCGYRSSEVKAGGGVQDQGQRTTLHVQTEEDLRRDVIKSETASVFVPELDLETSAGAMGGVVTTVEGLMTELLHTLKSTHSFQLGDSADPSDRDKWKKWFADCQTYIDLDKHFTLVLDDPLANSFVNSISDDPEKDERLKVERYERTAEQDEEFGIEAMRANAEA